MINLYGIPNCDKVKKARNWLEAQGIDYTFHDFKKTGPTVAKVSGWIADKGVDVVLNKRGTTFRKLSDREKALADDAAGAVALLVANSSMIKRPVVEHPGGLLVGFKADEWEAALK